MIKLCPECEATGKCWFKEKAEEAATRVKNRTDLKSLLDQAIDTHMDIADLRIKAREKMCPNLNDIDPDYPGKNLL
jgi:hypothetical protein